MTAGEQGSAAEPRVAVISGGTRGIGFGIASCLARDGYSLVLGYNSNAEAAEASQRQLQEKYGVVVEVVGGDVALPTTWDALFDRVESRFDGHLTAFVNNAGLYIGVTSVSESQPTIRGAEGWEAAFRYYHDVYTMGFRRGLTKALGCKGLRHVLAISAQGCNGNSRPWVQYEGPGQAKAGMEYLVRLKAVELAGKGISVNAIVPGYIRTEAWSKIPAAEERLQQMVAGTPAGRWGTPEEVGEVAAFLCSPRAAFLTGATIPVDGGLHLT